MKTISRYTSLQNKTNQISEILKYNSQECLKSASRNEEPSDPLNRPPVPHKGSPSCDPSSEEHVAKEMELHILQVDHDKY